MSAVNFQRNMTEDKWNFIYYVRSDEYEDETLKKELISEKCELIYKPEHITSKIGEFFRLKKTMREKKIDVVHSHMQFHSGVILAAAYFSGVKKRIAHSHFTRNNRKIGLSGEVYRRFMRICLRLFAADRLACSAEAGKFLYGKSFQKHGKVISNGVDASKYRYDAELRRKIRNELNVSPDTLAVGHIGSLYWVKNQKFLVRIFAEIKKIRPDSVLLLCGEIRDGGETENSVYELGLTDSVKFLGVRSDVPELLTAMDVLVFPSLFEAQPIVPIEAQAAGLPCLLSDRIIPQIKKNENAVFLSLEETPEVWAKKAIEMSDCDREKVSVEELKKHYDIKNTAKQLERIYEE